MCLCECESVRERECVSVKERVAHMQALTKERDKARESE